MTAAALRMNAAPLIQRQPRTSVARAASPAKVDTLSPAKVDTASPAIRMTVRGRRALALLVATPVLALGAFGALQATVAIAGSTAASVDFDTVTVQQGQSLWQIAETVAPGVDPREVVAEIELLNSLTGSIQPGQQLAIPSEYTN